MKTKENNTTVPLNAFLAQAGICSRRAAIDLIKKGRITVNENVITQPGYKIKANDIVKYKDQIVKPEKKIYILLNKPKGFVTTDERGGKNILELLKSAPEQRLYPIAKLDRDTTGLIIITNDGDLSQNLDHPRNKVFQKYYVVLDKPFNGELMDKLKKGIYLEDGKAWVDKINFAYGKGKNHLSVEIHGGKKRIIKRMFAFLGFKVVGLDRVNYAGLTKKALPVGRWRFLSEEEIDMLAAFAKS
jgi:23S rRNA pseudouridine2605 synthase